MKYYAQPRVVLRMTAWLFLRLASVAWTVGRWFKHLYWKMSKIQAGAHSELMRRDIKDMSLYDHDCPSCEYMGMYAYEGDRYDLYWCWQIGFPTVLARWGDKPSEYLSGMPNDEMMDRYPSHPTCIARNRAERYGFPVRRQDA